MKVLVAHNFYKQSGGEDLCVASEIAMLRQNGDEVIEYFLHNDAVDNMWKIEAAARTIWNPASFKKLRKLFRETQPDIAHFHNTFPLMSPAAYYAARAEGVGVVQTLHNFRLTCAGALLLRDGSICEDCLGSYAPWSGIWRKCYRGSHTASATVTTMLAAHRAAGTWQDAVDIYIALTEFGRHKFISAGLPHDRIMVKPNFLDQDPGLGSGGKGFGVYVGRLSHEKGIGTLLDAWRHLGGEIPLKIIGDGPMAAQVEAAASQNSSIKWLGQLSADLVYEYIGHAAFLIVPSICFEGFPRVIVEAFAKGTPVIASRMGAMAELIEEDYTGLFFRPGDGSDLASAARRILVGPTKLQQMRRSARMKFENDFTSDRNYEEIKKIYARVLDIQAGRETSSVS
ncbi:glycosyltransferase [Dankookia rubra]|uniref:Glycosyltransferase n=1 Tax=Dankookia rubra TaxID=1442381 RepID=A0A4R5Q1C1_9PROT|nr:glycosyltransferase family 4 protein [Dankookia rubra]TDH56476.1 glycosyltransferase [Dankookia rubra]